MFILFKDNRIVEQVTDVIFTDTKAIVCIDNVNAAIDKDQILIISNLYPSKDMLDALIQS